MKTLTIFGTRPEAIKLAPLLKKIENNPSFDSVICVTGQHREMLDQVLEVFDIAPHYDLDLMKPGQSLNQIFSALVEKIDAVMTAEQPAVVLVHGDTTSAMAACIAAYNRSVQVLHVEAGLRTNNLYSPWPEEGNRRIIGALANYHYAPTANARKNLLNENVDSDSVIVTGNTVIDALFMATKKIQESKELSDELRSKFSFLNPDENFVLMTGHRRESFGGPFENICRALLSISKAHPDYKIVYPVHLNPNVRGPVEKLLSGAKNIILVEPQDYLSFVYLMAQCSFVMTDSGGIQEEAPSLGKPVLVLRTNTERPDAVAAGTVKIVGTDQESIFGAANKLITDQKEYDRMASAINPYGDGSAAEKITQHMMKIEELNG